MTSIHEADDEASKSQKIEHDYKSIAALAEIMRASLVEQIDKLLNHTDVAMAFPIQSRVKSLESVIEKSQRINMKIQSVKDIHDIVGLRLVIQFSRDVDQVCKLIEDNLIVTSKHDTKSRLREDQFGYSSVHIIAQLKSEWLAVPTFSGLDGLHVEIQVRTAAQHIWASASHLLQYKQENSVPPELRRAIHRVSALLETVDLEFERFLSERDAYRTRIETNVLDTDEELNVDTLEKLLNDFLPPPNKDTKENYGRLLRELTRNGISTHKQLIDMYNTHSDFVVQHEAENLERVRETLSEGRGVSASNRKRSKRGVYFTHVGLIRIALGAYILSQDDA